MLAQLIHAEIGTRCWEPIEVTGIHIEDYRKLNSKKYRPMAARKESRNVLSGRR